MSLDRFKTAQQDTNSGFATALAELQVGRKTSHWIWYIFPQLASLGRSSTARFYGLADLEEAGDYLREPLLGERLLRAIEAVERQLGRGGSLRELMGSEIDCFKLVSSLTLFELAAEKACVTRSGPDAAALKKLNDSCARVLALADSQGFPRCKFTLLSATPSAEA